MLQEKRTIYEGIKTNAWNHLKVHGLHSARGAITVSKRKARDEAVNTMTN